MRKRKISITKYEEVIFDELSYKPLFSETIKKLKKNLLKQNLLAQTLTKGLRNLNGLSTPKYDKKIKTHSFYVYPLIYDQSKNKFKVSRKQLISKLRKKDFPL